MPAIWPPQLPQNPASFSEQPKDIVVRTPPDNGPLKTRRRFTKAAYTATMTFLITIEQYLILRSFFNNDLQSGAISMNFMHPWERVLKEMYVLEPPSASNDDNLGVNVSMKVEYF